VATRLTKMLFKIKSIAIFIHNHDRLEVAERWFTDIGSNIDMTCPESGM
jgi:5-bromo-4-chloroindolyl phosphate hydrolysis protein